MPTHPRYIAFWSYTRFDDEHDGQWLTGLRKALEAEVRALSGVHVEIFQDVDGIAWGERWKSKTKISADDATFLIPIITPSYFKSEECRSELEQFVQREKDIGFSELILPLYYIESQLGDQFVTRTDQLKRVVADHNYRDFREHRHRNLNSYEARQAIKSLATDLIERLKSFARWHLSSKKMEAQITAPVSHARVPRKALILGTLRGVSEWVEIWLVVETGSVYHPRAHLGRAGPWQATFTIGRSGDDANREFVIHILAVIKEVSNAFDQYREDAGKQGKWPGAPKPKHSRVLVTRRVVRDDSASPFSFMRGVYDEWCDGVASGGMIRMTLNGPDNFATEAQNHSGVTEWTGSIKMDISSNPTQGKGTYKYSGKADSGEHRLTVDAVTGDAMIEGKNTSQPGGKSFQTVWKAKGLARVEPSFTIGGKEMANPELLRAATKANVEALELSTKNLELHKNAEELKNKVKELEAQLALTGEVFREGDFVYREGERRGFCSRCWAVEHKLVHIIQMDKSKGPFGCGCPQCRAFTRGHGQNPRMS